VFTVKRFVPQTGDDLYYLFNEGVNATQVSVSLENSGNQGIYEMDCWSGEVRPELSYVQRAGR
jgi:hypothetical protein